MFKATKRQEIAKASFHRRVKNNPMIGDVTLLSEARLERLAEVKDISAWLKQEGFKEWFLNPDSNRDLLEAAAESAIMAAIEIVTSPLTGEKGAPKAAEKLAAAKLILEYAGYAPTKKSEVEVKSTNVDNMTEEQIDEMLAVAAKDRQEAKAEAHVSLRSI